MSLRFQAVSVADYEKEASEVMDGDAIGFFNSGSDGEETYKENELYARR